MLSSICLAAFSGGILWAILGISFLIFIHEYGHYSACRLTGTRTEAFSIGFGPRLFGWESAPGTEWRFTLGRRKLEGVEHAMDFRFALIPLGGYVKMAGENPGDPRSGASDEFASKSIPQRLFIVSAGVIMNAVTAFVFYSICFGAGIEKPAPLIGGVAPGSAAWLAGVQPGDRVRSIDGHPLDSFVDLVVETAFLARDSERPIVVERDGRALTLAARGRYAEKEGVVKLGVEGAQRLRLGSGPEALVVGPTERAFVAGVEVAGGLEAARRLGDAFETGLTEVEVQNAAGTKQIVRLSPPAVGGPPAPDLGWKVGIEPFGPPTVREARGAAHALAPGDVLLAALDGSRRASLETLDARDRLPFDLERVDALVVRRGSDERTIPVAGVVGRGAVVRLLSDVLFEPSGTAVAPIQQGRLLADLERGRLLRYGSVPAAGLLFPGERLVKVDGASVPSFEAAVVALRKHADGTRVSLRVARVDGEERDVELTPVQLEVVGTFALTLSGAKESLPSGGVLGSMQRGAGRLWRETVNTFRTIGGFFSGNIAFTKNIAGPITLVSVSSRASEESFLDLLWFLAYVSVMLAVLNVLPIPVLDGGHVVFLIAEKLRGGRPLSDATIGRMQLIGLVLLLTLMFFALRNDFAFNF